jgi:hypothetical protein
MDGLWNEREKGPFPYERNGANSFLPSFLKRMGSGGRALTKNLFLMGGLRGEGAQIKTKRSLQKNSTFKRVTGRSPPPPSLRDLRSLSKKGGLRGEGAQITTKRSLQKISTFKRVTGRSPPPPGSKGP